MPSFAVLVHHSPKCYSTLRFGSTDLLEEPPYVVTRDILYADDTLLLSHHTDNLQHMLLEMITEGAKYGLELNWDKTLQMQISTNKRIAQPNGDAIKCVREAIYLGGLITCDGKVGTELTRRLGEATKVFKQLGKLWNHASIGKARKLTIYKSCVISKLLYSLDSIWLLKADRTRLDAFHYRCLRKNLGMPHSCISRVRNVDVLDKARESPLSEVLLGRQEKLYKQIASSGNDSLVKQILCENNGEPKTWTIRRRRGRPRQQWAKEVFEMTQYL